MRFWFAHLSLRDGSTLYVNPHAVQSVKPDGDNTVIVFISGDVEIVAGYAVNIVGELVDASGDD